ncbi:MAG: hypothetical protein IPO07_20695 [Haliscomenobacter sp.]|nr:exodeoxyribonuclease VII large subunit [Haliscomenobacter sp.]MBK9490934.1 hypothetical protein [Haliscomenobacter sp.]
MHKSLTPGIATHCHHQFRNRGGIPGFSQHLGENAYGYAFKTTFSRPQWKAQVEAEVLKQLRAVQRQATRFDAVALIRGGGAKLDLAGFDSLALCQAIADFPLPIFTGIGHDVDETLVDLVAHRALKTPTAVADFLIQHNLHFESQLVELSQYLRYVIRKTCTRLNPASQMYNRHANDPRATAGWLVKRSACNALLPNCP